MFNLMPMWARMNVMRDRVGAEMPAPSAITKSVSVNLTQRFASEWDFLISKYGMPDSSPATVSQHYFFRRIFTARKKPK